MDTENDLILTEAAERIRTEKFIYSSNVSGEMCARKQRKTKESSALITHQIKSLRISLSLLIFRRQ